MGIAQDIFQAVSSVFQSYDVPDYIWQAIAHMETGGTFDTKALGDNGRSFGLFQLFTDGGQGDAYSSNPDALFDPKLNAQVAAPEIARAYHLGKQMGLEDGIDLAAFTAANSGHPGYGVSFYDPAIQAVFKAARMYFGKDGTQVGPPSTYGSNPDGSPMTANDWWKRITSGGVGDGMQGYIMGFNSDGTPRSWSQYWGDAADPYRKPDGSLDWKTTVGQELIEKGKAAVMPDWWKDQGFWQKAGVYGLVIVVALILIAASVNSMVKPQAG